MSFLQDAERLLAAGTPWAGLGGDSLGFVLGRLAATGRWLVVVDEPDAAERLLRALRFFHPEPRHIVALPPDDTQPYDGFSPSPAVVRQRIAALARVASGKDVIVVAPARALAQRVPTAAVRERGTRVLQAGDTLDRDDFAAFLTASGYVATQQVTTEGWFAVRGDVVDVWPTGLRRPVRIDFFDDEVERIRRIDPESGRPASTVRRLLVLPAREERLDDRDYVSRATAAMVTTQGRGQALRRRFLDDVAAGIRFSGIEAWLPALVDTVAPLDVLDGLRPIVVSPDDVAATLRDAERTRADRYGLVEDAERPLPTPDDRFVPAEQVLGRLEGAHRVFDLSIRGGAKDLGARTTDGFGVRGAELAPAVRKLEELAKDGVRVGLVASTERKAEALREMLEPHGCHPRRAAHPHALPEGEISLVVGDLARGFLAPDSGWAFVPATALFGSSRRRGLADRIHAFFDASVQSVHEIKEGDLVVHQLHGVGRYLGLTRMELHGAHQDFARLEYRGGDLMYLPVVHLPQLSRYVPASEDATVKLDKLGGATWAHRKQKVRDAILKMADELLRTQAQRELATRPPYPPPGDRYHAFEAAFPYDETPDQAAAIDAIDEDLSAPHPMDRLLCGDVGFGKTEVAMRAAMRVVEAGKQVAVLCPTTVLAYQHQQTFTARFAGLGVRVGMLSRFVGKAAEREVQDALAAGKLDIVVGTTALLGRSVRYADLGLLVVDEEHRFGVRQKERLKKLRAQVDVLSMSATPIPRTLQMGLSGVRDMSLMATPPKDRLAVQTSVARRTRTRVRDAILHELARDGQAFFVHNRVETLPKVGAQIHEWVPEARVAIAHGQMDAKELERVLVQFVEGDVDVLACTAIMETGIDLPNVNTMLIDRADRFGIAQLYQLRGRVGRGSVRARCILLVPEELSGDARRRVQVMVENSELGAGFSVAAADLEMRGAGNLLGDAQSGNIDAVGYEVWLQLLEDAVREAQGRRDVSAIEPEVELPVDAFLPEHLFPEVEERFAMYRRLSGAPSASAIDALIEQLELDHGELPEPVHHLAGQLTIRLWCRQLGIQRASFLKVRALLEWHPSATPPEQALERLVTKMPKRFKVLRKPDRPVQLQARFTPKEAEQPVRYLKWLLVQLRKRANKRA